MNRKVNHTQESEPYTGKKAGTKHYWQEGPDVRFNKESFQNNHYKHTQRTKEDHALKSKRYHDDSVLSNRDEKFY